MSKYKNNKIVIDNIKFDSQKEGWRYRQLKLLERSGNIQNLELQPVFKIQVKGKNICRYIADFSYTEDGAFKVEDVKSPATAKLPVYRLKKKLVKAIYDIDIIEV